MRQAWRRKWILLAVIVLIPLAAYLLTARQTKVYEASTLMKVAPQNISISNQISFSSSGATETATIIKTTGVARLAALHTSETLHAGANRRKDWRSTLGMFAGDDVMKEIIEEGRKIRERDREQSQ
jgi:hypothetical protein